MERRSFLLAMDALNDAAGEEVVEYGGIIEVIDYKQEFVRDNDYDIVMCVQDDNPVKEELWVQGIWGKALNDILLRTDLIPDDEDTIQCVMMHELIHYIGATNEDHAKDSNDLFHSHFTSSCVPSYSSYDRMIIRSMLR